VGGKEQSLNRGGFGRNYHFSLSREGKTPRQRRVSIKTKESLLMRRKEKEGRGEESLQEGGKRNLPHHGGNRGPGGERSVGI